jgi:hypothetical protein
MPRAALLSIHARVEGTQPSTWEDPSLVQLWGPRFSAYVVAKEDLPVFSLGRLPDDPRGRQVAEEMAERLRAGLNGRRITDRQAGEALGIANNRWRYAAPTGTLLIRWEGARAPTIWTVPRPQVDPREALLELARRHLHIFGPTTPAAFAEWAGIGPQTGRAAFAQLESALTAVRTPIGEAWILSGDEQVFRAKPRPPAPARLLPSGDAFWLLQGADRELLVPEPDRRQALWTSRVWPGALLEDGKIVGTWRRADTKITIEPWRRLSLEERAAVEAEAESLPLPGAQGRIQVRWLD